VLIFILSFFNGSTDKVNETNLYVSLKELGLSYNKVKTKK